MLPNPPRFTDEMLEDCLQALHRLESEGRPADITAVAAFARISPEATGQVLVELETRGLVANGEPERIALTPEGERLAAGVLRRHRLSERLFADLLGMPWDRVHEEAMRLEHALSPEAEARLARLLNHPATRPHGGPIPTPGAPGPPGAAEQLDRVPAGRRAWIQQIVQEEASLLRYLASLGLLPGAEIHVEEVAPLGGPLLIRLGGARYALGRDVAAKILVQEERARPEAPPTPGGPGGWFRRWRRRGGHA
jgi:DtxR family transcriptional regulator, Mn-dependent transcriptional regulator